MATLYDQLATRELPYFGVHPSGVPFGDERGFREIPVDENLDGPCDPLVEIGNQLLTRPMYFEKGWADDSRLFLRKPALFQLMEYDKLLQQKIGWRLRITDAFRPWTVQQKGFCWGVNEVLKNRGDIKMEEFLVFVKKAIQGDAGADEIKLIEQVFRDGDSFFCYVLPVAYDHKRFPAEISELMIIGAANLGIIDLPLDPYAITHHSTGGAFDAEWLDAGTGRPVNMGVAVDTQGPIAAFPFFEDRLAPIMQKLFTGFAVPTPKTGTSDIAEEDLMSVEARQNYYHNEVRHKPLFQKYLQDCGVDIERFLTSTEYRDVIWRNIQHNRRVAVAVGNMAGVSFFGLESWDGACNDQRGGVRFKQKKLTSGNGSYAIAMEQSQCAWGNATKLWEKFKNTHSEIR